MSNTLVITEIDLLEVTFHEMDVPCKTEDCEEGATYLHIWDCGCRFTHCDSHTAFVKTWLSKRAGTKWVNCRDHGRKYLLTLDTITFHVL